MCMFFLNACNFCCLCFFFENCLRSSRSWLGIKENEFNYYWLLAKKIFHCEINGILTLDVREHTALECLI